jgi:hypothetical protein
MAVVDGKPDEAVAARCREMGVAGFAAFARRYGQRITDLSAERALAILNSTSPPPTENFPDRWTAVVQAKARSKEERNDAIKEMHANQIAGLLTYLRKKDEEDGFQFPATIDGDVDADSQHRRNDRPVFGSAQPTRANRRARSPRRPPASGAVERDFGDRLLPD